MDTSVMGQGEGPGLLRVAEVEGGPCTCVSWPTIAFGGVAALLLVRVHMLPDTNILFT